MSVVCNNCKEQNRNIAKYCKKCGSEIITEISANGLPVNIDNLVGLDEIKKEIGSIVTIAKNVKQSGRKFQQRLHTIFIGNTGTAKTKIAGILAELYYSCGIISTRFSKNYKCSRLFPICKGLIKQLQSSQKRNIVY